MQNQGSSKNPSSKDTSQGARDEVLPGFVVSSIISGIPFLGLLMTVAILTNADQITRLVYHMVTLLIEGLCIAFFWRRLEPSGGKNFATATFAVGQWAFMGGCLITVFGLRFGGMGDLARNVALLGSSVIAVSGFFFAIAWAQAQPARNMVQTHTMVATSVVLAGFTALLLKGPGSEQNSPGETLSARSMHDEKTDQHLSSSSNGPEANHATEEASHAGAPESAHQDDSHTVAAHNDSQSHGSSPHGSDHKESEHRGSGHGSSLGAESHDSAKGHVAKNAHDSNHNSGREEEHARADAHQDDEDPDAHGGSTHSWSYEGENSPSTWGKLKPAWKTCSSGREQSPVDIPKGAKEARRVVALSYDESPAFLLSNGELLEVALEAGGHAIINGKSFALKRIDMHAPSEHRLGGTSYPLEIQFVHVDTKGHTAVISAFVEKGPANPDMGKILGSLPVKTGKTKSLKGALNIARLLPREATVSAHQYMGSLTTPPCTEGVLWTVLRKPLRMSSDQLATFSSHFAGSNRPLQPLGKRTVGSLDPNYGH